VSTHAPRTDVAADQSGPLGFDHCVIAVSDWGRSDAFYRDVLGAEIPPHDELWGQYRFGDWKLNVHGPGFDGLKARKPVEPGNSDLCFVWPGTIDDAVEHLRAHGIEIEAGPFRRDAGDRGTAEHVYFRDPDGSLLELVTYG
jgi:catechol 2,3-dioxygenase-like lactoylglutathione lyase family enzyme